MRGERTTVPVAAILPRPDGEDGRAAGTTARSSADGGPARAALAGAVPTPASPGLLVAGTLALVGALRARRRVSVSR